MISWFELRHAWRDLRSRDGWHDYTYTTIYSPLHGLEMALRRLTCWAKGHRFWEGDYGERGHFTWKRGCMVCFKARPEWPTQEINLVLLRRAWGEIRRREWRGYAYTTDKNPLLHGIEMGLRKLVCLKQGHLFWDEYEEFSWRHECAVCLKMRPGAPS